MYLIMHYFNSYCKRNGIPLGATLLYLKNVIYWPEHDRLRSKHVAVMWPDCIYFITVMMYCRIFRPRKDEVTGEWRRLHNEELNDLYSSPNIVRVIKSRRMGWAGHVARMGKKRGVYRVLVGKPEGRRALGRPKRRWVDNIRTELQEVGCGYMVWIGLAQDRDRWRTLVSAVMNFRVPWNAANFLTSCKPVSFSRRTLRHGVSK